ncbi:MAG: nitrogen fixation protein NifX [Candidatus Aquicultor sp.]|nr:nitrogen fixation protein NifX [Candidatus Aquicultor sp.]
MKVAFATTDGVNVDEHFGRSGKFSVYEVTVDGFIFIEERVFADGRDTTVEETKGDEVEHDNVMRRKVENLSDCKIIYFTNIGAPSAARLVNKGLMPLKVKEVVPIRQELQRLLETINNAPPPWLKRAIANGR